MSVFIVKALVLQPTYQKMPFIYTEVVEAPDFREALIKSGVGHDSSEVTITLVEHSQDIQEFIAK